MDKIETSTIFVGNMCGHRLDDGSRGSTTEQAGELSRVPEPGAGPDRNIMTMIEGTSVGPAEGESLGLVEPGTVTPVKEETDDSGPGGTGGKYSVILYNDDWHGFDEVILQLQKATECSLVEAARITYEAHQRGRAVCFRGSRERCHRVAGVLREIRLQVEVSGG